MTPEKRAQYVELTRKVLWITVLAWFAYEIVMLVLGVKSALISPVVLHFMQDRPQFVAFLFYLLGHLTWPQKKTVTVTVPAQPAP